MNSHDTVIAVIPRAKDVILRFQRMQAVGKEEIEGLLQTAMALRDEPSEAAQKAFILAMEIDAHYRDPFDRPIEKIEGLAYGLNELVALTASDSPAN